jgi:hypothetical protein
MSSAWDGNANARIQAFLACKGYSTLREYLQSIPGVPFNTIAGDEFAGIVAPIQLVAFMYDEASGAGGVREAAQDALARDLNQHLPDGWGQGDNADFNSILALSGWSSEVCVTGQHAELRKQARGVSLRLRSMNLPTGWKPAGPDDALLIAAFDAAWPK